MCFFMNIYNIYKKSINLDDIGPKIPEKIEKLSKKLKTIGDTILNTLGTDLSESIYHKSFEIELRNLSISYNTEAIYPIIYKNHNVGVIRPDLILNSEFIVELKSIPNIRAKEINQLKVYLKHTSFNFGFLINFYDSVEIILIIKQLQ